MILQYAGIMGIEPWSFSLRELLVMLKANRRAYWEPLAGLIALTYNVNRDPKKHKSLDPDDINPYTEKKQDDDVVHDKKLFLQAMKAQFIPTVREPKVKNASNATSIHEPGGTNIG